MGLSIDRAAVRVVGDGIPQSAYQARYGFTEAQMKTYKHSGGIKSKDLRAVFERKLAPVVASTSTCTTTNNNEPSLEAHRDCATIWLATLLAATLFANKSGNIVRFCFFDLMWEPDTTHRYAWGTAVLASMYRALGEGSRRETQGMDACPVLLQVCYNFRNRLFVYSCLATYMYRTLFAVMDLDPFSVSSRSQECDTRAYA